MLERCTYFFKLQTYAMSWCFHVYHLKKFCCLKILHQHHHHHLLYHYLDLVTKKKTKSVSQPSSNIIIISLHKSDNVLTPNDIRRLIEIFLEANVNPYELAFGKGWSTFAYHSKSSLDWSSTWKIVHSTCSLHYIQCCTVDGRYIIT